MLKYITYLLLLGSVSAFADAPLKLSTTLGEAKWREYSHKNALDLARSDNLEDALTMLEIVLRKNPSNTQARSDYVSLAVRQKEFDRAEQAVTRSDWASLPAYALEDLAIAYFRTGQWHTARTVYDLLLARFPNRLESGIAFVYFLTDVQAFAEARKLSETLIDRSPGKIVVWEANAYVHKFSGNPGLALLAWQKCLEIDPGYATAKQGKSFSLQAMGGPLLAGTDSLSVPDTLKLTQDRGARLLRFSLAEEDYSVKKDVKGRETTTVMHAAIDTEPDQDKKTNRKWDLVLGYVERKQYEQAIYYYQTTSTQVNGAIPGYAKRAVAEAYMSLHRPWEAIPLLLELKEEDPSEFNTRQSLFYAYVEMEAHAKATEEAVWLAKNTPLQVYRDRDKITKTNQNYTSANLMRLMELAYAGKPEEAERAINELREEAGGNEDIRVAEAQLKLWRGKPREAKLLLDELLAENPHNDTAKRVLYDVLAEIGDTGGSLKTYTYLASRYPHNPGTLDLHEKQEARVAPEWSGSVSYGKGGSEGGSEYTVDTRYRTSQVNGWRGYARYRYGQMTEYGYAEHYTGIGFEKLMPDRYITGELGSGRGSRASLSLQGKQYFNDDFSADAFLELNSVNLSYKGYGFGVTGDRYGTGLHYHPNDGFKISANYTLSTMSDSNNRTDYSLSLTKLLYSDSSLRVSGTVAQSWSTNSDPDKVYFSPKSSKATGGSLTFDYTEHRFRDSRDGHIVTVDFGSFGQTGYSGMPFGGITYERVFAHSQFAEWRLGVSRNYHPWDGEKEWATRAFIYWNYKFR